MSVFFTNWLNFWELFKDYLENQVPLILATIILTMSFLAIVDQRNRRDNKGGKN